MDDVRYLGSINELTLRYGRFNAMQVTPAPYTYPLPDDEADRLDALHRTGLLDTESEEDYDRLTGLASDLFDVPIALVSLLDEDRQWYKSCVGVDHRETDREHAICNYTISGDQPVFEVPDTLSDPRFRDLPGVQGEPGFRSYLGTPIETEEGHALGTFCILDTKPRRFTDPEKEQLQSLAHQVQVLIKLRRTNQQLERESSRLQEQQQNTQAILDGLDEQICILNEEGRIVTVNDPWMKSARDRDANLQSLSTGASYFQSAEKEILQEESSSREMMDGIRDVIQGERSQFCLEYECSAAHATDDRWFVAEVTPLPMDDRSWVIVAHREITRRKQAEQELEASRRQYKDLSETLQERVEEQTETIQHREETVVLRLLSVLGHRDDETGDHVERIGDYAAIMGREWGWEESVVREVELAAAMHDAGKVGIPDEILQKPGKLTDQEFDVMKQHTTIGAEIFEDPDIPLLRTARKIALNHHENWDGSGYPNGLEGDDIPLVAQMVSIVDVYDALTHDRVYRDAFSEEKALEIIEEGRGSQFNPEIHDCFLAVLDELRTIEEK